MEAADLRILLALPGLALIVLASADMLTTTVAVGSGAGPITARVSEGLWRLAVRVRAGSHVALHRTGVAVMLLSVVLWLGITWVGWTLVFASAEQAVVDSATSEPAGVWERTYFAGYTLLTLGNGEFRPEGVLWQLATVLAVANGFAVVTLAISYVVPVVSAATEKRQMAAYVSTLAANPQQLLIDAFDGHGVGALDGAFADLPQEIALYSQRHHTYPMLHYFHSVEAENAAPLQLTVLDEALTILEEGLTPQLARSVRTRTTLRRALDKHLDVLARSYVAPAQEPPPRPDLRALREAGIPTVDDETFARRVDALSAHRCLLRGLVEHDGWKWSEVYRAAEDSGAEPTRAP